MIHDGESEQVVENYVHQNVPTIRQDGIRLVLAGQTTLEEVFRVTREDKSKENKQDTQGTIRSITNNASQS